MTRPVVNLKTSLRAFERMHAQVDRGRGQWVKGKVEREALLKLLMDHSTMIETLRKHGYVAQDDLIVKRVKVKRARVSV